MSSLTITIPNILRSIPENLIIDNTEERSALIELLLEVKRTEEAPYKVSRSKYQDPKMQSLKDKLQNHKHKKLLKNKDNKVNFTNIIDVIINDNFTYIQISNGKEAAKLLKLMDVINTNQQKKDHMLKALCSKLKRIIKYQEYPIKLRTKNHKEAVLNKNILDKDEILNNLNSQIELQKEIITYKDQKIDAQTKSLLDKDEKIQALQNQLDQIKKEHSKIIRSLQDKNVKLTSDHNEALSKLENKSYRNIGVIGSNLQRQQKNQTNSGSSSNSAFMFGL